jgi:ATP-dependent Lhr-like helicase
MRVSRLGPPAGSGRWSLVADLSDNHASVVDTESLHAVALQLLERHGVLTREAVLAEGVVGGFAGVYGVLKVMEDRGQIRRGYFVEGLGAAQFAMPGAVDRLRAVREKSDTVSNDLSASEEAPALVLMATDPAQPFGGAIAWPVHTGRPARSAKAMVVLHNGAALAWFDPRASHVVLFADAVHHAALSVVATALASLATEARLRTVEVRKLNGDTVNTVSTGAGSDDLHREFLSALVARGFQQGYRGLVLRS